MRLFILCSIFIVLACTPSDTSTIPYDWGPSPWPEIRKERISSLLPNAMKASNVDAWLVICRENDNDPMADHMEVKMLEVPLFLSSLWTKMDLIQ